jgi:hypothetical protein
MGGRYRTQGYKPRATLGEIAAARGSNTNSVSIQIEINQKKYWGFLNPSAQQLQPGFPESIELYFWGEYQGTISYQLDGWTCSKYIDPIALDMVGDYIFAYFQ